MPSLRVHAKDPAIGGVTQTNLEHVARILECRASRLRNPILKWFYPDRKDALVIELLAATFSRVRGVPEPLPDQFDCRVAEVMSRDN